MSTGIVSSFLSKDRIIAKPGFNRWLAAPAALAVHLCIGQVYAFSVFNLPLTKVLGVTQSLPEDWKLTTLGWIFSLAIVFWACRPRLPENGWSGSVLVSRCFVRRFVLAAVF